jgi:hypothetical protein
MGHLISPAGDRSRAPSGRYCLAAAGARVRPLRRTRGFRSSFPLAAIRVRIEFQTDRFTFDGQERKFVYLVRIARGCGATLELPI